MIIARIAIAWLLLVGLAHADGTFGVGGDGLTFAVTNGIGKKGSSGGGGGGATGYTISGPSSGNLGAASTNFTVTATGGTTTFNGSQTITIADGSKGGTFTPSVGSPGTSTVTVTPTNGASTFTFTYKPIVVATLTLTPTNGQAWSNPSAPTYASAANCTASGALITRMDGAENQVAVDALICGMVTDGTYSLLDTLYVGATNSVGNSRLNWAQNNYNLTSNGSITFTPNQGWTGDGTTGYYATGFTPNTAGGQMGQNNTTGGACIVNNRTVTNNALVAFGAFGSANNFELNPYTVVGTNGTRYHINSGTAGQFTDTGAQGSWIFTRTVSTTQQLYQNGALVDTESIASGGLPDVAMLVLAGNADGTPSDWSTDQIAYVFWGSGMVGVAVTAMYNRLHTYLQTVGETTAC